MGSFCIVWKDFEFENVLEFFRLSCVQTVYECSFIRDFQSFFLSQDAFEIRKEIQATTVCHLFFFHPTGDTSPSVPLFIFPKLIDENKRGNFCCLAHFCTSKRSVDVICLWRRRTRLKAEYLALQPLLVQLKQCG